MSDLLRIVSPAGEVVQAITGQHVIEAGGITDLDAADVRELARFLDAVEHLKAVTSEAIGIVNAALVDRMDKRLSWSEDLGAFTISTDSPAAGTTKHDTDKLVEYVQSLVEAEAITAEGAKAVVEWVTPPRPASKWKVKQAGVNALAKLSPEIAAGIEATKVPVEPPARKVKLTRKGAS